MVVEVEQEHRMESRPNAISYGVEEKEHQRISISISVLVFERENKYLKLGRLGWRLERPALEVGWAVGEAGGMGGG